MEIIYDEISTRDAFGNALFEMAAQYKQLIAIGADTTKSMGMSRMSETYPDRVVNIGIAEQNMALMAAGAASCGAKAVAATYAPFASMRICEQIRTFICYPGLDVKIIGGLGGLSGNIEGVTHQGLEDIGVLRSIAGLVIAVPADAASAEVISRKIIEYVGPVYLRLGRGPSEKVFDSSYKFEIGKANVLLHEGDDAVIFCNGAAVARVLRSLDAVRHKGFKVSVVEMPCVKPIDKQAILQWSSRCKRTITAEEHNIIGGLGSVE